MNRVVITGMGVVAPNAVGLEAFRRALCEGRSGISHSPQMRDLGFACQVGGLPPIPENLLAQYLGPDQLRNTNESMKYAVIAAVDCWRDSGLPLRGLDATPDWDTAAIIGTCAGGADTVAELVGPETSAGRVRRLGSSAAERSMASCGSACVGGLLGLGGQVTTNSSACATGTEAIINGYWMIREGRSERVLAGSSEPASIYTWATLDALRVTARQHNDRPQAACRPLSASAGGLVPSGGAGILMLESLSSAQSRNARVYAEVLGGYANSGGQRNGGSITAANPESVKRCIREALEIARTQPNEVDYINGHLTGTEGDVKEIRNLSAALDRTLADMPWVNATKSLIGHGIGAAGSMECVATLLQLSNGFLHPSLNCDDFHPGIAELEPHVPKSSMKSNCRIAMKTSFGFGDVNACVLFGRLDN